MHIPALAARFGSAMPYLLGSLLPWELPTGPKTETLPARTAVIQRCICAGAPQNMYQALPQQQQQHSVLAPALLGAGAGLLGGVLLGEALEDRTGGGWGGGYGGGYGGGQDVSAQSKHGISLCSRVLLALRGCTSGIQGSWAATGSRR